MKSKLILIFLFLIICFKIKAQFLDKNYYLVDSLIEMKMSNEDKSILKSSLQKYHHLTSDTAKINCLSYLIENIIDENIWTKYNRLLYKVSKEKQIGKTGKLYFVFKVAEALALNNFGYYYFNYSGNIAMALKYYTMSMQINESIQNYEGLIVSYSNIANVYQNMGDLGNAIEWNKKSLSLESKVRNKFLFMAPINNMAQIYLFLNDTINALKNLKKCFALSSVSNDKIVRGHLLHNIGLLSSRCGDLSGIQAMKNALALQKQIGDKKGIVQSSISLAGVFESSGNLLLAKEYLKEARAGLNGINNPNQEGLYYNMAGNLKERDADFEGAIEMYEKSVSIFKQFTLGPDLVSVLTNLLHIYGNNKKYAFKKLEAYELLQKVSEKVNKGNLQKLLLKQRYDDQLKIQGAIFKAEQKVEEEKNISEKRSQQYLTSGISIILFLTIIFSFFLFKSFSGIKQKNIIISEQKLEVEKQKHLVEEKHKDITDSINYAQKIQSALIISEEKLNKNLKESFVIFKPRDIVSGDFYWFAEHNGTKIIALADCTGHGVPGAFMSMIGITLLNQIVNEKGITSPALILNSLRKEVIRSLNTDDSDKRDGMDMAIIAFNEKELYYAGANSQVFLISNNGLIELKPNKQPIGIYEKLDNFTEHRIEISENLKVYLFSDGIVDQFGGISGKKIKTKQFKEWLIASAHLPLNQQKIKIEENLNNWKKNIEQTDDISLIGIKLS